MNLDNPAAIDYDSTPQPAYQVWLCGRCDSELVEKRRELVCETCGARFVPGTAGSAAFIDDVDEDA